MAAHSYSRAEKLKSRKTLNSLFTAGKSIGAFPVKVFYVVEEQRPQPIKAGVGVSSRHFKKAVDRNRIKRLLRECYRLNKTSLHDVVQQKQKALSVFFLYVGKELPDYETLSQKMKTALNKLEENIG